MLITINNTIEKFRNNVRQIAFFKNLKQKALYSSEGIDFTPLLYIKSNEWKPPKSNKAIEKSLNNFKNTSGANSWAIKRKGQPPT